MTYNIITYKNSHIMTYKNSYHKKKQLITLQISIKGTVHAVSDIKGTILKMNKSHFKELINIEE